MRKYDWPIDLATRIRFVNCNSVSFVRCIRFVCLCFFLSWHFRRTQREVIDWFFLFRWRRYKNNGFFFSSWRINRLFSYSVGLIIYTNIIEELFQVGVSVNCPSSDLNFVEICKIDVMFRLKSSSYLYLLEEVFQIKKYPHKQFLTRFWNNSLIAIERIFLLFFAEKFSRILSMVLHKLLHSGIQNFLWKLVQ